MESYIKLFLYYKQLGDKTFQQIKDDSVLFSSPDELCNSIAVIVKHLRGNMLSRWTDFLESDGEKEWRDRDDEFISTFTSRVEMTNAWEEGWACLFNALSSLSEADLRKIIYIRNKGHMVDEAIQRQLAHYAYHIGQIVFIGRLFLGDKWNSLSIARGESEKYNATSFEDGKRKEHFTDSLLDNES